VQAVHDGVNVFFMLQVDGAYAYTKGYFAFFLCYILVLVRIERKVLLVCKIDSGSRSARYGHLVSSEWFYLIGDIGQSISHIVLVH
jgi:hypothetical protein